MCLFSKEKEQTKAEKVSTFIKMMKALADVTLICS